MSVDNSELLMLLATKKSRPLTENNLIVQSTRGIGSTSATDALEKEFYIYMGSDEGDQVFSVTFPVTIFYSRKWDISVEAISNALIKPTEQDIINWVVTPIDPSKPAIIDVYNYY